MTQTVEVTSPRGRPARFAVRDGTSDLAVLGSTFAGVAGAGLVDEYRLRDLRTNGHVVDVGAHIGSVGIAVLLDNPEARVTFIEPVPENVALLRANLAENGLADSPRVTVIEGAVGTDTISYAFGGDAFADTNRYIGNLNVPATRDVKHTTLSVRRVHLRELLPIDALKFDCEGGEWQALRERIDGDRTVAQVPFIFGEYHYAGSAAISRALNKTHTVEFDAIGDDTGLFWAVAK